MSREHPQMLVIMPYWEGDKRAATDAALLAANLLTKRVSDVGFLFVSRSDSTPPSPGVLSQMRLKFDEVLTWKCNRHGEGFPMGPNEIYFGIFQHVMSRTPTMMKYDFIFVMESDVVLTRRDWHLELFEEWQKTIALGKIVCGAWIANGYNGYKSHINASALYDRNIAQILPELVGCDGKIGWDWFFGRQICPLARASDKFVLDHQRPTITRNALLGEGNGPLVYHGVKDDSARSIVADEFKFPDHNIQLMTPQEYAALNGYSCRELEPGKFELKTT